MTELDIVRPTAPKTGPRSAFRLTLEPSAELLAMLEANPTAELRCGPPDSATDEDTMKAVLAETSTELKAASVTAPLDGDGAPKGAASIQELIDRHPSPYGLGVRMRRRP